MNPYQTPASDPETPDHDYALFRRMVRAALWLAAFLVLANVGLWLVFRHQLRGKRNMAPIEKIERFIHGPRPVGESWQDMLDSAID